MNSENIILELFVNLGDKVVVNLSDDTRNYRRDYGKFVNGTIGTVVGFIQHTRYRDRLLYSNPGVYSERGIPLVRFEDRTGAFFSAQDIAFADPTLQQIRVDERQARGGYDTDEEYSNTTYLGPLPETPFWEMDTVLVTSPRWHNFGEPFEKCPTPAVFKVDRIDYQNPDKIYYHLIGTYASGHTTGEIRCTADELTYVEPGNLWKYHNNQPCVFSDIHEEIRFNHVLRKVHEVRNPKSKLFKWSLEEAMEAIREGIADGFNTPVGPFGLGPRISVYHFDDRDLGERVRTLVLNGDLNTVK